MAETMQAMGATGDGRPGSDPVSLRRAPFLCGLASTSSDVPWNGGMM